MKIRQYRAWLGTVMILFLSVFSTISIASELSKPSYRAGKWEFSVLTKYIDSTTIDFDGGAQAKLNDEWAWGFGFGYNFTSNWAFNFDASWTNVGYSGTWNNDDGSTDQVSGVLRTNNGNFSGIYNFSNKRFTPFIGASVGWIFIDTNIPDGPPGQACWYDPWWGYICTDYQQTKTSTKFTYGATLGLRFEMTRDAFLRGSIGRTWADIDKTSSTPEFNNIRFDIGMMFN